MKQPIIPYSLDVLGDTPECITEVTDRTQFVHHNGMLKHIIFCINFCLERINVFICDSNVTHEILKTQCFHKGIT